MPNFQMRSPWRSRPTNPGYPRRRRVRTSRRGIGARPSTPTRHYLEKLGYKQELSRTLGLFSAFGVQFTSIAIASGIFTTLIVGFGFFGPASFWSFLVGGALQVFTVGLAVAELVSAYPLAGGVYQITGRITGKPWLAWQTGWWLLIAHTVAVTACAVSIAPFIAGWFGVTFDSAAEALPWTLGLIVLATVINIAGVKVAAVLNNIGVVAECICVVGLIGVLLFFKHPTQPLASSATPAEPRPDGHWFVPFLFAMILPAYAISSFDATGNASEETKDAAKKAPLASVLANVSSYVVGIVMVGLLMLAIQDFPPSCTVPCPSRTSSTPRSARGSPTPSKPSPSWRCSPLWSCCSSPEFGCCGRRPAMGRSLPPRGCARSAPSASRSTPP